MCSFHSLREEEVLRDQLVIAADLDRLGARVNQEILEAMDLKDQLDHVERQVMMDETELEKQDSRAEREKLDFLDTQDQREIPEIEAQMEILDLKEAGAAGVMLEILVR